MKLLHECTAYNQYINTNVEKLINNLCDVINKYDELYYKSFIQYVQLKEATGDALDEKGRLLNFNRNIVFNDPLNVVIPTTEGIDEYEVLYDDFKRCRLGDDAYRRVLMLLSQTRNTASSVTNLSKVISDTIDADVFVGDNMDMQYITYYFLDRIPGWLEVSMHNYDILPRPAGMSVKYISAISRFFGFLIQYPYPDYEATAKVFSPFWKTRFPTIFHAPRFNKLHEIIGKYRHVLGTLTDDEFNALHQKTEEALVKEGIKIRGELRNQLEIIDAQKADRDLIPKVTIPLTENPTHIWYNALHELNAQGNPHPVQYGAFQSKLKTLQNWEKRREVLYNYQDRVLKNEHDDIRKYLYYDKKTKWYYYKPAEGNGEFNPLFQSSIYQDTCGVWFMQDTLVQSAKLGYVTLRSLDYAQTHHTKVLPNSPFLSKYRQYFSSCIGVDSAERGWVQHDRVKDPSTGRYIEIPPSFNVLNITQLDCFKLETLLNNIHEAIRTWHRTRLFDASSFRAVLDFEYRNLGIIQRRADLKRIMETAENPYERRYYREQYEKYNAYLGTATEYSNLYSDKESKIYKDKQYLIFLRSSVRKAKEKLSQLYNASSDIFNTLSSNIKDKLPRDMHRVISQMRDDLGEEHFNDFEKSRGYGGNSSSDSAAYLSNYYVKRRRDQAYDRYNENLRYKRYAENNKQACDTLRNDYCWRRPHEHLLWNDKPHWWSDDNWKVFEWAQRMSAQCFWHNATKEYNWGDRHGNSYDTSGFYCTPNSNGDRSRGCRAEGGNSSWWEWSEVHRKRMDEYERKADDAYRDRQRLDRELNMRSIITENDSLQYLMNQYYNAEPEIEIPSARYHNLPVNDFTII